MPALSRPDLAWALVRVVGGLSLAGFHGWGKVSGGVAKFVGTVQKLGFPYPEFFAWCAAFGEFGGGFLVAVGFMTRPAAAIAAFTMAVALFHHRHDPVAKMELAGLYLVIMVAAVVMGSGRYGVDGWRAGSRGGRAADKSG